MRGLVVSVVAITSACSESGHHPDPEPCAVTGDGIHELLAMVPEAVPLRGAPVALQFTGFLGAGLYDVWVSGELQGRASVTDTHVLTYELARETTPRPIGIAIFDDEQRLVMSHGCIGRYEEMLEAPTFQLVSGSTFGVPLVPELARPCARRATAMLRNTGDPIEVLDVAAAGDGFTIDSTTCGAHRLEPGGACSISSCFDSTTPGVHPGRLIATTRAGSSTLEVAAEVFAPSPLDASFGGDGAVDPQLVGAPTDIDALALGTNMMTWTLTGYGYSLVTPAAQVTRPLFPMLEAHGFPAGAVWDVAVTPLGGYVLATDTSGGAYGTVFRIGNDGTYDASFTAADVPITPNVSYLRAIEYQAPGRLLVIGRSGVVALDASSGALDTSYGGGVVAITTSMFERGSAIDSAGRLYLDNSTGLVRLTATGAIDAGFALPRVDALLADGDGLLVASGVGMSRVTSNGTLVPLALSTPLAASAVDLDRDGAGRIYVTLATGEIQRYSAAGVFDRFVGLGRGAKVVRCAASGCYAFGRLLVGDAPSETYVARL